MNNLRRGKFSLKNTLHLRWYWILNIKSQLTVLPYAEGMDGALVDGAA